LFLIEGDDDRHHHRAARRRHVVGRHLRPLVDDRHPEGHRHPYVVVVPDVVAAVALVVPYVAAALADAAVVVRVAVRAFVVVHVVLVAHVAPDVPVVADEAPQHVVVADEQAQRVVGDAQARHVAVAWLLHDLARCAQPGHLASQQAHVHSAWPLRELQVGHGLLQNVAQGFCLPFADALLAYALVVRVFHSQIAFPVQTVDVLRHPCH